MEVYEKSYKGLWLFVLAMLALLIGLGIPVYMWLPQHGARFTINLCNLCICALMLLIRRTEQVYWINGVEFEAAKQAGSERRKAFALRYLRRFAWVFLGGLALSLSFALLGLHQMIDFSLITLGLIVAAISTVTIKL